MKLKKNQNYFFYPLIFPVIYFIISWISKISLMSVITFIVIASKARFSQASEVMQDHLLTAAGLSASLLVGFLILSQPLFPTSKKDLIPDSCGKDLIRYFFIGTFIGLVFILTLVISGQINYWGVLVRASELIEFIISLLFRSLILFALIFPEEFLIREKLYGSWLKSSHLFIQKKTKLSGKIRKTLTPYFLACLTALIQVGIRSFQFELTPIEAITLFFISIALSIFYLMKKTYICGAATLAGFYFFAHIIASSPLFGTEFSGLFVIKPLYEVSRLSGGSHGPLASLVALIVAVFICFRFILSNWVQEKREAKP